ncbi:hypothetical protein [Streptomyces aidingensis]|uniref:hypothetical protein n=1 Tax=Streptomyces aidingensis TaxID=910347 RepID=UPI001587A3D5|nr:hypothetical protein [Streptomyces aidingensis]
MPQFADEARPRLHVLLRMASDDPEERRLIRQYAESTPDPPLMSADGIATRGCPRCRGTMWRHRDGQGLFWVCSSSVCGWMEM